MTQITASSLASRIASPRGAPSGLTKVAAGIEAVLIILGTMMMQNVLVFLVSGNAEPETIAAAAAGDPVARASWYPLYLGILIAVGARFGAVWRTLPATAPVFALLALMLLTMLWSVLPDITLRRWIALAFTLLFGILLYVRGPWIGSLRLVGYGALVTCVLHLLVVVLNPAAGIDHELHAGAWKGMLHEKNALGGLCAINFIVFGALAQFDRPRRRLWQAATALAALLVLGSTSTTSFLAVVVVAGLFVLSRLSRISPAASVAAVYVATVATVAIALAATVFSDDLLRLLGKDPTLTGRTEIWAPVWRAIEARPWQGYGLGAYWQEELGPSYDVRSIVDWDVPNAHNLWLDMGLAAGFPGLIGFAALFAFATLRSLLRVFTLKNPWPAAFLLQGLLFSFSESTVLWSFNTFSGVMFAFFTAWAIGPARLKA